MTIGLGARSYDILIGPGVLADVRSHEGLPAGGLAVVVTNETVAPLYAERVMGVLAGRHEKVRMVVLPDGETHKDWPTLNRVFDELLGMGADRRTVLYALGGGVVGDMTGFAAACYMRGISFVQVPTTLLAQVDSSVGGKTGINHPLGKNMIGAFYQPLRVLADVDVLATLPDRELRAGLAEVIKYGPIADREFFEWVEANIESLLAREPGALRHAIRRSCEIKAQVVGADERESGVRAILNFGHTFGHAIEAGVGYGNWLHGEAVACGMVMAAELSALTGPLPMADVARLTRLIERAGLPVRGPVLEASRYLELMRQDKKAERGAIRFVLLDALGVPVLRQAPDQAVRAAIERRSSA